jgi:[acyl-carrier-protein] S-malonyltransferase
MKIAFLFPGQGAQTVGMGLQAAQAYPAAAQIFKRANEIVGYDLQKICFEGPEEKLNSTTISQPAIFVTSAAFLDVLRTEPAINNLKPDVTAGLSLGEYTALYAAGAVSFEDALTLVQKRGTAMQEASDATVGSMVSIIGLDGQKVNELCEKAAEGQVLKAVNFNCPGQIVISGDKEACRRAEQLAVEFGAIKAITLAVAGAFHTQMMSSAGEELKKAINNCKITCPADIKVLANINAQYYQSSKEIAESLVKQLTSPILWQQCIEKLLADGCQKFYEIGPGKVLTGLMKRINRKANCVNISTIEALSELKKTAN